MSHDKFQRDEDGQLASYAWPGGYPLYYLSENGLVLCPGCANDEDKAEGDPVIAADANWEDPDFYCEDCERRIESAYADPDEE